MSFREPSGDDPHKILIRALAPWTSIAEPLLEAQHSTGDRYTAKHDLFNVGGFRLTFVPTKDPSAPETIGRIEYVFRARSLGQVSELLREALGRFGFAVPPRFGEVITRASRIPDDLAGLEIGQRLASQTFDWAAGWRGFAKLYAECAQTGNDMRRTNWMVELCAFQPPFRAASDL
jgi:hypothetical protein